MSHCVYTYAAVVRQGRSSIWSLRVSEPGGELERALTVEVHNATRRVVQARGRHNRSWTADERVVLKRWAEEHSLRLGV